MPEHLRTLVLVLACVLLASLAPGAAQEPTPRALRFTTVDVLVDSGTRPLAAWQVEVRAVSPGVRTVGVEGGEHPAYQEAPYYDPAAMSRDVIVLAAFDTGAALPAGATRVARLHLAVEGSAEPDLTITLQAAATLDGAPIEATARLVR